MAVIQMFPADEPLTLVPGQTGPLIKFHVPIEPVPMFLRFIALWTDNTPLERAAPTFGIKLGEGVITPVAADGTEVVIPGPKKGGTALCRRLLRDIYLLMVINHSESATTWKLRIKNTADETLRFVWVNSNNNDDTFQPWMALDDQLSISAGSRVSFVVVRNWGTGPLTIEDRPGTPIGAPDSPVVLVHCPAEIAPHGVDHMAFSCGDVPSRRELKHTFMASDEKADHTTLRIVADQS
jgi:hypothetical protein